jgi:hypothetical protein
MLQSNRFSRFLKYAASTRSHHNGDHGLVLHTAETVANVLLGFLAASPWQRSIGKPAFDLSLTLLAALLHDAAKVDDYYRLAPDVYSTNLNCKLLGHEQTMLKWIAAACSNSGNYLRILAKYSTDSSPKAPTIPGQRLHHFWLKYSTLSNHSRGCSH